MSGRLCDEDGEFAARLARWRREVAEAVAAGTCAVCREPAADRIRSDAGRREYRASGVCEACFDRMFAEEAAKGENEDDDPGAKDF